MPRTFPSLTIARLVVGLAQGVCLFLLYQAAELQVWPATSGLVFAPLLLIWWFTPIIALLGLGNMRPRTLIAWALGAALIVASLAVHDIYRDPEGHTGGIGFAWGRSGDLHIWPSPLLVIFTAVGLFIAHALIAAGDADGKIIAGYPRYFDAAWKHGVQLALSDIFVGLFWSLLWLGTWLFKLIDIDFFAKLIEHRWFAIPATTLALAGAIHLTDARAGIVRGMRTLILILLSWLLPLIALFVAGFLVSLPFTGLAPLWKTRFAMSLLLAASAALVVLTNAVYQDGQPDHAPPRFLRHAASLAGLMLAPLVAIAGYALALRVGQYGWTSDRVIAASCIVVASCYALGYAASALRPGEWFKWLGFCNVITAFVTLGLLLALFSPVADPARISVADQLARLTSGKIAPEKFDLRGLRFDSARYGREALEKLKVDYQGENAAYIHEHAEHVLNLKSRWDRDELAVTAQEITRNITSYPAGRPLPESFTTQKWASQEEPWLLPICLQNASAKCDAFYADLDGDGVEEVIIAEPAQAVAFKEKTDGSWYRIGNFNLPPNCPEVWDALRAGEFKVAPPVWKDLEIAGSHFRLSQTGIAFKCH